MIHKAWSATSIIILAADTVNHFCIFINIYRDVISSILCLERRLGADAAANSTLKFCDNFVLFAIILIFITETQNYTRHVRKVDQKF